jgi:hypothetical protein
MQVNARKSLSDAQHRIKNVAMMEGIKKHMVSFWVCIDCPGIADRIIYYLYFNSDKNTINKNKITDLLKCIYITNYFASKRPLAGTHHWLLIGAMANGNRNIIYCTWILYNVYLIMTYKCTTGGIICTMAGMNLILYNIKKSFNPTGLETTELLGMWLAVFTLVENALN